MSSDDTGRDPAADAGGFVDPADGPDTVCVPAFEVTSPEVEALGRRTELVPVVEDDSATNMVRAYLEDGAEPPYAPPVEVLPPEAPDAVDVSDLEWWGDEQVSPSWDGDAPLAAPLDAPQVPPPSARSAPLVNAVGDALEIKAKASDIFEREQWPRPMRAGLKPRAPAMRPPSSPPPPKGAPKPSLTVADLARRAEQARASAASNYTPPSPKRRPGPSPTRPPPLPAKRSRPPQPATEPEVPVYRAPVAQAAPTRRRYPKMLALLSNPGAVPYGDAPPKPPAVPGTFFPVKPAREAKIEEAPDVDVLLQAMAEGLFVGGDSAGSSEIMITLRDEFFQGTQLRVGITEGGIEARLIPPDRGTYRHLCAELHRLESRLESRGLKVKKLRVEEP